MKNFLLFTFFSLLFFSLGFLSHALFFPDVLANGISDIKQLALPNPTIQPNKESSDSTKDFMTEIVYDNGEFTRHNITIGVGSYLLITNISNDYLMWLNSNNPLLSTPRGYGKSEQIKVRMDERGQFIVADKNNPKERLVITVK